MVRPERRTPGDLVAAAVIAVVIVVVGVAIWWTSDARATVSQAASDSATNPPSAVMVAALAQAWTAASPATWAPVLVSGDSDHRRWPANERTRPSYRGGALELFP